MAVREFNYEGCKDIIAKVQEQANNIRNILNECNITINENVGISGKWSGARADNFKNDWQKTSDNFNKFVELINEYSNVLEQAYEQYQSVDY